MPWAPTKEPILSPFSFTPFLQEKEQEAVTYLATFYEDDI